MIYLDDFSIFKAEKFARACSKDFDSSTLRSVSQGLAMIVECMPGILHCAKAHCHSLNTFLYKKHIFEQ